MKFENDSLNLEFVRLLAKSGWTQRQAAGELGITESAVSQYLNGNIRPRALVIQHFKLKIGDKMPLPGKGDSSMVLREAMDEDPELKQIFNLIRSLPKEDRIRMQNVIKTMLENLPRQSVNYRKKAG